MPNSDTVRELTPKERILISRRERLFRRLQMCYDSSLIADQSERSLSDFRVRYDHLEVNKKEFESVMNEYEELLCVTDPKAELPCQASAAYDDLYYKIQVAAEELLKKERLAENSAIQNQQNSSKLIAHPKLPKLDLPKFDGQLHNWTHFYDTYMSLVHYNATISPVEKFHYLVSCLSGPPLTLVHTLPITNINYPIVFQLLCDKYQNKRVLAAYYLDRMFNYTPLTKQSLSSLNSFIETFYESMSALKALNLPFLSEFILFYCAVRNLDSETRKLFETKYSTVEVPSFEQLIEFVQNQVKIIELSQPSTKLETEPKSMFPQRSQTLRKVPPRPILVTSNGPSSCALCKSDHSTHKCDKLIAMDVVSRINKARALNLCTNCLRGGHLRRDCNSTSNCTHCGQRHHSILHLRSNQAMVTLHEEPTEGDDDDSEETLPTVPEDDDSAPELSVTCHTSAEPTRACTTVILGTAVLEIKDASGTFQSVRTLIDSAAQDSFMTTACAQRLGLPLTKCNTGISGFAGQPYGGRPRGLINCTIKTKNDIRYPIDAIVVPKITTDMPVKQIPIETRNHFKTLQLADPNFDTPGPVEFLLGGELFPDIYDGKKVKVGSGYPAALHSIFGWVIAGRLSTMSQSQSENTTALLTSTTHIDNTLKRFWEVEQSPCVTSVNPGDQECESIFLEGHSRDENGRYIVPLPFKEDSSTLGHSYDSALNRFHKLERRLTTQPTIKTAYVDFMREYELLGHMQPVTKTDNAPSLVEGYVIPHHCVLKPSSSTTKLRTVFDASCKTSSGQSLNDLLHCGPKLQNDIVSVILNFRLHPIVFTADISKMYRQILIVPGHRKYQHILWRESSDKPIIEYELNTVTYGVSSAPYLALRTLRKLAEDEGNKYPRGARVLRDDIYVDDVVTGTETLQEALDLRTELVQLLQRGGFQLRKWSSSSPEFLQSLPPEDCEIPSSFHLDGDDCTVKILGIIWSAVNDCFSYSIAPIEPIFTKRAILAQIARTFDPLGWVSPVVFRAKCIIQRLWRLGLSWDEEVPEEIRSEWQEFIDQLPLLSKLKIDRFVWSNGKNIGHLIGFCDASELGYACAVYLKVVASTREIDQIHLLMSKSKVAPLKTLSVPRLELSGALILSRLLHYLHTTLKETIVLGEAYAFTDSATVLAWLRTPPYKLKTFVGNRVVEILENVPPSAWRYVPTAENPSDMPSRGLTPAQFLNAGLWWHGPPWLKKASSEWPKTVRPPTDEHLSEVKTTLITSRDVELKSSPLISLSKRFSNIMKLQRTIAYCRRFIANCRASCLNRTHGPLKCKEINDALLTLIRDVQSNHFGSDIANIEKGVLCSGSLQKLCPFLDSHATVRVGGRLKNSNLPEDAKHPMLLPKCSHLTNLIIDFYHQSYLHVGPRTLQSLVQRKFWIIGIRNAIRSRISRCVTCFKNKPGHCQPLMGDLPVSRVQQGRCFLNVGIDFGGPFMLKESKRRNAKATKAYVCLFICLAVKAVHLELVSEMSTDAFLACFDRFTSRRGICSDVYTDCGTNFIGANTYLTGVRKHILSQPNSVTILNYLSAQNITFHTNPPSAPHFGGIFEAGIKSSKYHLKRVIGTRILTFEEFSTVLTKVEAILNSRPLCSLSPDPIEIDVLTPGHFIIGAPLVAIPEPILTDIPMNRLSRWQLLQQITQSFWIKWRHSYLHTLQQRSKWLKKQDNLKVGDLVLIDDAKSPPMYWPLGRVTEIHPGKDKVVRVATIRTSGGTLLRPVVKLCPLPIS